MDIKNGSYVITSKGNHGQVIETNGVISQVKIGRNVFPIENTNLVLKSSIISVEITCRDYQGTSTHVVYIPRNTVVLNMADPYNLKFSEVLTKALNNKLGNKEYIAIESAKLL